MLAALFLMVNKRKKTVLLTVYAYNWNGINKKHDKLGTFFKKHQVLVMPLAETFLKLTLMRNSCLGEGGKPNRFVAVYNPASIPIVEANLDTRMVFLKTLLVGVFNDKHPTWRNRGKHRDRGANC